jgi:hypothetical protein
MPVCRWRLLAAVCVLGLLTGSCTTKTASTAPIRSGVSRSVTTAPAPTMSTSTETATVTGVAGGRLATVADSGPVLPPSTLLTDLSDSYSLTPSGPLTHAATVTIPLPAPVPAGTAVIAATRETSTQPWSYLSATLDASRTAATFTTTHFSVFSIFGYDLKKLLTVFKTDFIDGLDDDATQTGITAPVCTNTAAAAGDGFHLTHSATDTIDWCLELDSTGHRTLQVSDNRPYPVEVAHTNMAVIRDPFDPFVLSSLSHFGSGKLTIVAPGDTATFNADLSPGGSESISTSMDSFGQSLYALQTGLSTLVAILTKFGAGSPSKAVTAASNILGAQSCADALGKGSGALLAGCFDPTQLIEALGSAAVLLAPLMIFGPLISFFHSEFNATVDQFTSHDEFTLAITRTEIPVLGSTAYRASATGYGLVEPPVIDNAGDGTSHVDAITWSNWGQPTATGHGTASYAAPGQTLAYATPNPATVVATDLGECAGVWAYRQLEWYFPGQGETFDPAEVTDICTPEFAGGPSAHIPATLALSGFLGIIPGADLAGAARSVGQKLQVTCGLNNALFTVDGVEVDADPVLKDGAPVVGSLTLNSEDQMGPYGLSVGMPAADIPSHLPANTVVEHSVDTDSVYWLIPQPNGWTVWIRADKQTINSAPSPLDQMGLADSFGTANLEGDRDGGC